MKNVIKGLSFIHYKTKIFNLIIFTSIFIGLLSAGYLIQKSNSSLTSPQKKISLTKLKDQNTYKKWADRIEKNGGRNAYKEFTEETKKKAIRERHYDAHLFGEALYATEGTKGISVCDTQFDSGCYHSFLALAVYTEGLKVVTDLSNKCIENLGRADGGCQHGIGHGILSSVGYDLNSLNKSIDVCNTLATNESIKGCLHGVFMEHNFQTMLLDDGKVREFDESKPYFPCFEIDDDAREVCINQQAQWWTVSIKKNFQERIRNIDELCHNLPADHLKKECFRGFGIKLVAYLGYNVAEARQYCNSLTDPQGKIMCQTGITNNLPL